MGAASARRICWPGQQLSLPEPPSPGQLAWALVRGLPGTVLFLLPVGMIVGTLFGMASSRNLVHRFGRLGDVAAAWSRGELSVWVNDGSGDELGDLARSLEKMAGDLEQLLETRQELAAADERNRLARELHDTVKQHVFSVSLFLGSVPSQLDRDRDTPVADLERARDLAGRWSEKTGIDALLQISGDCDLPLEVEQAFYRVGQEALVNVARHTPDVALVDLLMPKMGGGECTRRLKKASPETRVVILTSYHRDRHIFPAIRAGAISYLLKDIEPEEIAEAVRRAVRGEATLHPRIAARLMQELQDGGTADPQSLTEREREVLQLLAEGRSNLAIAHRLNISDKTVKRHVSNILGKLHLTDRTQAAVFAWRPRPG